MTDTGSARDIRLVSLHRFPVKSCRGEDLGSASVEPWGLLGDRRWMLIDPSGEAVTAREANALVLVRPEITDAGLVLHAPDTPALVVDRPEGRPTVPVEIFGDRLEAEVADDDAAAWFSQVAGRPVRLVYLGDPRRRPADPDYADPDDVVSLADGFPVLLASLESLAQANAWIAAGPHAADGPVPMTRFRPNLVITGAPAFDEDSWHRVRVGEVVFRMVKRCSRCVLTTIDPDTAVRTKEPLASLARHRTIGRTVLFAVNLVPDAPYGTVRVGDEVEVLETH